MKKRNISPSLTVAVWLEKKYETFSENFPPKKNPHQMKTRAPKNLARVIIQSFFCIFKFNERKIKNILVTKKNNQKNFNKRKEEKPKSNNEKRRKRKNL